MRRKGLGQRVHFAQARRSKPGQGGLPAVRSHAVRGLRIGPLEVVAGLARRLLRPRPLHGAAQGGRRRDREMQV